MAPKTNFSSKTIYTVTRNVYTKRKNATFKGTVAPD